MKHHLGLAAAAVGCLALVACGGAAADTSTAAGSGSQSSSATGTGTGRGAGRNGTAGEVVQVSGSKLVLNTQAGDVTVTVTGTTVYTRTHTGTIADIAVGVCLTARGQKDGAGTLNVQTVAVSPAVNGACTGPGGFGGGPGGGAPGGGAPGTGTASGTSTGTGPNPNFTGVRGLTTAVNGTTVTVKAADGTQSTVTIPTTVTVSSSASASQSDLSIGDCVLANGQKDAAGAVTARSVSIVPAGPTGCFTGGAGFGGFGGGGRGGGAGGGATPRPVAG